MSDAIPNPCRLCGKPPYADKWSTHFAVYCYNELETHDCRANGRTLEDAIELWNRWNPLPAAPAAPAPATRQTILALIRAKLRR